MALERPLGKCSYLEMWPRYQVYYLKRLEICVFVQKKKKKSDFKMLTQHFQTKQNSSVESTWPVYQAFGFETTMAR